MTHFDKRTAARHTYEQLEEATRMIDSTSDFGPEWGDAHFYNFVCDQALAAVAEVDPADRWPKFRKLMREVW